MKESVTSDQRLCARKCPDVTVKCTRTERVVIERVEVFARQTA